MGWFSPIRLGGSFLLPFILRASWGSGLVIGRSFVCAFAAIEACVRDGLVLTAVAVFGVLWHLELLLGLLHLEKYQMNDRESHCFHLYDATHFSTSATCNWTVVNMWASVPTDPSIRRAMTQELREKKLNKNFRNPDATKSRSYGLRR